MKRAILLTLGLVALALAQSFTVQTFPDITGTAATVQVATSGSAKWVQLITPSGNSAVARWGDSSTTSSRGGLLPAGSGQFFPPIPATNGGATQGQLYDLSKLYVYVGSGDKVTVVVGH